MIIVSTVGKIHLQYINGLSVRPFDLIQTAPGLSSGLFLSLIFSVQVLLSEHGFVIVCNSDAVRS